MIEPPEEQIIAGKIAHDAIQLGKELCRDPISKKSLDAEIDTYILDHDCEPALKGYHPSFSNKAYEWATCIALNEEAVHSPPHGEILPNDLITIDLVVEYKGWHADTARTFTHGNNKAYKKFIENSNMIFNISKNMITANDFINTYGRFVESAARAYGYSAIKEFCGHAVGRKIHEQPQVPNNYDDRTEKFKIGKAYAIEPVLASEKEYQLTHLDDGWTISANCPCSHFEDTIFISDRGIINLTNN